MDNGTLWSAMDLPKKKLRKMTGGIRRGVFSKHMRFFGVSLYSRTLHGFVHAGITFWAIGQNSIL